MFQENDLYKIVFKLGAKSWPQVKRFSSLDDLFNTLRAANIPHEDLVDFVFTVLEARVSLLRPLPGRAEDWAHLS